MFFAQWRPTWLVRVLVIHAVAMVCPLSAQEDASPHPHWIWVSGPAAAQVDFQRAITVRPQMTSAKLMVVGHAVSAEILIDSQRVAELEAYRPLQVHEIASSLTSDTHQLVIRSTPGTGPAAFFVKLQLDYADGSRAVLVSDKQWRGIVDGKDRGVSELAPVDERLLVPDARKVTVDTTDNYEQWKHAIGASEGTDPATFRVTPGFEIERVRSAQPEEDSWVSLAFDPQGRAVVAMEQAGLLRMTLSSDGSEVKRVESLAPTLKECRGLVFAGQDLFANANNSKGLYRLQGEALDEVNLLHSTTGGSGHGRNALALGPDGKVYSIHGDSVDLQTGKADLTSPWREARRGQQSKEGHVIRLDPKTGEVETLTAGLRNPFGIAFNGDGEMFTYDADAEFDMGSPWYRPTRVNHLVLGGDYGWRGVTGSWPPYYPDHPDPALPNLDIGKGSPTAVKFGTTSHFPPRYRQALFVLDWTYGRILLVHAIPRGASYLCVGETFLQGKPLNVTGLDFAPDGSLYIVTGGRKTQSALYRIRYVGRDSQPRAAVDDFTQTCREFAAESRALRRQLESQLGQQLDPSALDAVWQQLGNDDPWIRYAARNVLEQQAPDTWLQRALTETDRLRSLNALMALARTRLPEHVPAILRRLHAIDMTGARPSERLSLAYLYVLCLQTSEALDDEQKAKLQTRLLGLYPDTEYLVNQRLSEALAQLNAAEMVPPTIELLTTTTDQREQMHFLFVLRHMTQGWTPELRQRYFQVLAQAEHYLGGQGMPGFRSKIREEALASLTDAERPQYEPLLRAHQLADEVAVSRREVVRKWTLDEVLAELDKIDSRGDVQRGAELFAAASCVQCHRVGGRGTLVGPDLTAASSRYSRRDLLESIVLPSKVIAENYRSLQIVTTDGKTYTGRPALGGDYRSPILRLTTDPTRPFHITEIPKREIEVQRTSPTSWMPEGLLDTLQAAEIHDLLTYIEARGVLK